MRQAQIDELASGAQVCKSSRVECWERAPVLRHLQICMDDYGFLGKFTHLQIRALQLCMMTQFGMLQCCSSTTWMCVCSL